MNSFSHTNYFNSILLFLLFTLTACGGGGGGSPASGISQGQFIDAAVEGITYTSGSTTGLTDAQGTFSYEAGKDVTFSIGGITLGTVSGSAIITPVQLVTGANNQTNTVVTNIVQFLLTIDDDHDATNGIQITPAISAAAANLSIDFTLAAFDTDSNVSSVIGTLTTASTLGSQVLVTDATAQTHLSGSLFAIMAGNYSGTFTGTDSGNWTVTITTNGIVSGSGNSNAGGPFTVAGSVNTSGTTSVSTSGNAGTSSWVGTINITNGTLTGSWSGIGGDSGTFSGKKL